MMLRKIVCIAIFCFSNLTTCFCQEVNALFENVHDDFYTQLFSVKNTPLFDKREIQNRKIQTCTVLQIQKNQDNAVIYNDSVALFHFDEQGNVTGYYSKKNPWHKKHQTWDTLIGKSQRPKEPIQIDSTIVIQNGLTIKTTFEKYKFGSPPQQFDTAYIMERVYDNKNRLISLKDSFTNKYLREFFCIGNPNFTAKYRYDKQNRIVYAWNSLFRDYSIIKYKKNTTSVDVYFDGTQNLKKQFQIFIRNKKNYIREKINSQITLYQLEKKSNLFSRIERAGSYEGSPVKDEFIFLYKYYYKTDCEEQALPLLVTN